MAASGHGTQPRERHGPRRCGGGFTLIELLIVVAIVGTLMALLLPALAYALRSADDVACKSNLRTLGMAARSYAAEHGGFLPPLADWSEWPVRYFWGTNEQEPDFSRGLLTDHLGHEAGRKGSVYECPSQPPGSYIPQGASGGITSTYGYNGYYLCPPATPGWSWTIGHRRWQRLNTVREPDKVIMFADTLMSWGPGAVTNNCLLDPPWIFSGGQWVENPSTTLCFRHSGRANVCYVSGAVDSLKPTRLLDPQAMIGYVGESNAPHYVPDYKDWRP
jgi:prepilin-type N-terminal cleavage/methylation domain-containing protein